MTNSLINFIKEARKRGFDDLEIKKPLIKQGWSIQEIEKAFSQIKLKKEKLKFKNKINIWLDNELLSIIEKRAEKNMMNVHEQIEDILRRSCLNLKQTKKQDKIDDLFLTFFSRKR